MRFLLHTLSAPLMAALLLVACSDSEPASDPSGALNAGPLEEGNGTGPAARLPSGDSCLGGCGSNGGSSAGGATGATSGVGLPVYVDADEAVQADAGTLEPDSVKSPFVRTESDAFSTFAADVDSASYDIFRRSLIGGVLPDPSEVRLEEFVNYFSYDYPAPALDAADPFSISLSASAHAADLPTRLLRVGIQAAEPSERAQANLIFLVDVSGSMASANKLPLVKLLLHEMLDVLNADDVISIVGYASNTSVRLDPTAVAKRASIEAAIDALEAGGSTAGASGIQLAYEQAQAAFLDGGINHVMLCTDGDFNLGPSSDDELVEIIEDERKSGVTLTALGFGARNNDSMMERVSNAGNGVYSVIFSEDQAIEYANDDLLRSMIHIAKDMKIQVEFNPDHVYAYRLLGYENRAVADSQFRDDSVDGGEVGAGHRVTALYELALTASDLPDIDGVLSDGDADAGDVKPEVLGTEMVRVKVRYKQPGSADEADASEVVSVLSPTEIKAKIGGADRDARWAMAVATFAEILSGSPYVDSSALPDLRALLAPQADRDNKRAEFLTLFDQAADLL